MNEDRGKPISPDDIDDTPETPPVEPKRLKVTAAIEQRRHFVRVLEHQRETFQSELGLLGKLFGGRKEKPGNISGVALIFCLLYLAVAHHQATSESWDSFERVFTGLISVVTLILGYLFGSSDRS